MSCHQAWSNWQKMLFGYLSLQLPFSPLFKKYNTSGIYYMVVYHSVHVSANALVNRKHMNVDCSNTVAASLPWARLNIKLNIVGFFFKNGFIKRRTLAPIVSESLFIVTIMLLPSAYKEESCKSLWCSYSYQRQVCQEHFWLLISVHLSKGGFKKNRGLFCYYFHIFSNRYLGSGQDIFDSFVFSSWL